MTAPKPLGLYHFTRKEHLASIARDGLCCDADAHRPGRLQVEIGNQAIKKQRQVRPVPAGTGGTVSDYVPWYFAPRSPMLYAIHRGNVPTYGHGQEGIVYLATTLGRLEELGLPWVGTDRNAALATAAYYADRGALEAAVDWPLMTERYWNNTEDYPDRRERRQAELLVHRQVPWEAIQFVATRTADDLRAVHDILGTLGEGSHRPRSDVRGDWYF